MRSPNEIDFWRGFALVTIFVNHVPGIIYERFTTRNVSISDSAELFVFLAGWSLFYVVRGIEGRTSGMESAAHLSFRLFGRALEIYAAQILITMAAIALIAGAALLLEQPFLLEWHNAAAVFELPIHAHVGLVLLSHQLGYFNILPLYVVLMLAAPLFALLSRFSPWALLAFSMSLWLGALATGWNLPTWPVEGRWFFNPLAWQFIFVLGFLLARPDTGPGALARRHIKLLKILALPIVVAGAVAAFYVWSPNPGRLRAFRLFFVFDKTFLSPARLIQFLSVVIVMGGVWPRLRKWLGCVSAYLSMLGRNSLNVFCVVSLLSLLAQIVRFSLGGGVLVDTGVICIGLIAMGVTGWISEWRERSQAR